MYRSFAERGNESSKSHHQTNKYPCYNNRRNCRWECSRFNNRRSTLASLPNCRCFRRMPASPPRPYRQLDLSARTYWRCSWERKLESPYGEHGIGLNRKGFRDKSWCTQQGDIPSLFSFVRVRTLDIWFTRSAPSTRTTDFKTKSGHVGAAVKYVCQAQDARVVRGLRPPDFRPLGIWDRKSDNPIIVSTE